MKPLRLEHHIPASAAGTYYTIPFPVGAGLAQISVTYHYERGENSIVDLGLLDNNKKFLGWSGSDKATVFVGPCSATPGYLMTDIASGEWHIIIGAYKIPGAGLPVRYEITCTPQEARWLTGDLHVHSDASDGQHDIPTLAKKAVKKGLNFLAVANHNNYSENLTLPRIPNLTLIPTVEWTHYKGHMNFFGAAVPFDNFIANTQEEMLALITTAKAKGALISANHPKDSGCPYLWKDTDCLDAVEVWNAPMRNSNVQAINWWHDLLLAGRKIPLIGGSDYHRDWHPALFAHPVTRVYAQSPSVQDIMAAIRRGRAYVTATVGGVELDLHCTTSENNPAMMGDTVEWHNNQALTVNAKNAGMAIIFQLVTAQGVVHTWRKQQLPARIPVAPEWRFAYLLAKRKLFGLERITAITNPIYFS